jgi:Zn-dependent metalloprotease
MRLACGCYIVPPSVLDRFASDRSLSEETRQAFAETRQLEAAWRKLRAAHAVATRTRLKAAPPPHALAALPAVTVYDCKHTQVEPGTPVPNPGNSSDPPAKNAFNEATGVAKFYEQCFNRNSVDTKGMTLVSSVHYGQKYNNAFWNGHQMTYGDGDGQIFIDFTMSNDVVGHELTHGVTQYSAGLTYADEPGALNESISDVFGSMYRQWSASQTVNNADWLIGSGIMGPAAKQKGFTCLRDMANPAAKHCLSQQPVDYKHYIPGGDPHDNSGIPNRGFCIIAKAIGGHSWEKSGKVWYAALTSKKAKPSMKFKDFASLTVSEAKALFPSDTSVATAVTNGWKTVGVL